MKAGDDPRPDQHKEREGGGYPDPPENSKPKPAPGGVGSDKPAGEEHDPPPPTTDKK